MKKMIVIFLLFATFFGYSQDVVFNKRLFFQVFKNHIVRVGSEKAYQENYKKQQELYGEIKEDLNKVVIVNEFIFKKLDNVHRTLKQGKKIEYFYKYIGKIKDNAKTLLILSKNNPKYAILLVKEYQELYQECIGLIEEVNSSILQKNKNKNKNKKEGKYNLMDPCDREIILEKMLDKARMINGYLLLIISRLQTAQHIAYIKQIPILRDYISLDKTIVEDIMYKWKNF